MAKIIEFPAERVSRGESRDRGTDGETTAELLFFTGVRYSRNDGGPVRVKAGSVLEKRTV